MIATEMSGPQIRSTDAELQTLREVYSQVRVMARAILRGQHHSLTATGLAHEAFASLCEDPDFRKQLRSDPAAILPKIRAVLKYKLVDYLRHRSAAKRPSGRARERVFYDDGLQILIGDPDAFLHVLRLLDELRAGAGGHRLNDPIKFADVIDKSLVLGFTSREVAAALGMPQRTAAAWIKAGKAWLNAALERCQDAP